jgi:hypothetical protein
MMMFSYYWTIVNNQTLGEFYCNLAFSILKMVFISLALTNPLTLLPSLYFPRSTSLALLSSLYFPRSTSLATSLTLLSYNRVGE